MARTFTAAQLESRLRKMTDTQNDTHLTEAEMFEYLSAAQAETIDKLIQLGAGEFLTKKQTFSTVANQSDYPLSTVFSAGDFYKLLSIQAQVNGRWVPLRRVVRESSYVLLPPAASGIQLRANYLPYSTKISAGTDVVDGINGFEEHTLATAAISVKAKKEEDTSPYEKLKARQEARMELQAKRDVNEPRRIVERKNQWHRQWRYGLLAYNSNVHMYDIVGDNIEIYRNEGIIGI